MILAKVVLAFRPVSVPQAAGNDRQDQEQFTLSSPCHEKQASKGQESLTSTLGREKAAAAKQTDFHYKY